MLGTQYMSFNDKRNKVEPLHCTHYEQLTVYKTFQSTCSTNDQQPFPPPFFAFSTQDFYSTKQISS